MGFRPDGDLTLLHGLQKSTLHFCWGSVDFICQHQMGKDWSLANRESLLRRLVDQSSNHVRRQQIGGELNPLK